MEINKTSLHIFILNKYLKHIFLLIMEINEVNTIIDKIYPNQINLKSFNFKKEV